MTRDGVGKVVIGSSRVVGGSVNGGGVEGGKDKIVENLSSALLSAPSLHEDGQDSLSHPSPRFRLISMYY